MAKKSQPQRASSSFFQRQGPQVPLQRIYQELKRIGSFHPYVEEYFKRALERHHHPTSPHITEKELKKTLEELEKNPKDPVSKDVVQKIRRHFGL